MRVPFKLIEATRQAGIAPEFEATRKKTTLEPEHELMLAVLQDAITCYENYVLAPDEAAKILFREAQEWICKKDSDWVFSFESICEALGLDPNYIRQGLLRRKERTPNRHPAAAVYPLPVNQRAGNPASSVAKPVCHECEAKKRRVA